MIFEAKLNSLPMNSGNDKISLQTSETIPDIKKEQALNHANDQSFYQHVSNTGIVQKNAVISNHNAEIPSLVLGSFGQGNSIDRSMTLNNPIHSSVQEAAPRPPPPPPPPPPLNPPSSTNGFSDVNRSTSETIIEISGQCSGVKVKDHPDYTAFFKMMKVPSLF